MVEFVGKCNISARLIKDSINLNNRLCTFELVYPRFIHGEVMTHRALSKNSSSSRAVPIKTAIQNIIDNPAYPVHWGKNQAGMIAREEVDPSTMESAKMLWGKAIRQSIDIVKEFESLGVHKQIGSRWSETGSMIKVVITGTDWDNLIWLRDDEEAQPEFRELASVMVRCLSESIPERLNIGEWHLPYIETKRLNGFLEYFDNTDQKLTLDNARKISASCCAQVSYRRLNESKEKALEIYSKLFSGRKPHMSPTEHQGTPIQLYQATLPPTMWSEGITHITRDVQLCSGNLTGWIQFRQTLPNNVYKETK
jgi:hypothetical protein